MADAAQYAKIAWIAKRFFCCFNHASQTISAKKAQYDLRSSIIHLCYMTLFNVHCLYHLLVAMY